MLLTCYMCANQTGLPRGQHRFIRWIQVGSTLGSLFIKASNPLAWTLSHATNKQCLYGMANARINPFGGPKSTNIWRVPTGHGACKFIAFLLYIFQALAFNDSHNSNIEKMVYIQKILIVTLFHALTFIPSTALYHDLYARDSNDIVSAELTKLDVYPFQSPPQASHQLKAELKIVILPSHTTETVSEPFNVQVEKLDCRVEHDDNHQ